jgi:hypothetical protein
MEGNFELSARVTRVAIKDNLLEQLLIIIIIIISNRSSSIFASTLQVNKNMNTCKVFAII